MFTGIVESIGTVVSFKQKPINNNLYEKFCTLTIKAAPNFHVNAGDSIAIDGCCLTAISASKNGHLEFHVGGETLNVTTLGHLQEGHEVNLERAMGTNGRFGGHFVSGHVDGIAIVRDIIKLDSGWELHILIPARFANQVIEKGSICLHGVSLTINKIRPHNSTQPNDFTVEIMLIPHTILNTVFKNMKAHDRLNFETDLIGKYIERQTKAFKTHDHQAF